MSKKEPKKAVKPTKKNPPGELVTKEFVFKLTDEEKIERHDAAGALHVEVLKLKDDAKEAMKQWKEKIDARTLARDKILLAAESGEESRAVEATMVKKYDEKVIEYYFEGNLIEDRTMTPEELQANLFENNSKRAKKQTIQKQEPQGEEADIKNVIKMETNKKTKHSAVDGAKTEL